MTPRNLFKIHVISKKNAKIKLLGDSITHGVGGTGFMQNGEHIAEDFHRNPDGFCWAKIFKEYVSNKYGASVTNNACTGTTIEFIIDHFDTLVAPDDDLIICTIGTNNRHQYMNTGKKRTRADMRDSFYKNIVKLYTKFCEANKNVIFVANIPASEENEKDGEDYWRILHMIDIRDIYKEVAANLSFPLISLYDLFLEYCEENNVDLNSLLSDGLHPNDDGYKVMANILISALED